MNKFNAVVCDDCGDVLHHGVSMNKLDLCFQCRAWRAMMHKMTVPVNRVAARVENANWFLRAGWTSNIKHPQFNEARELAIKIGNR